MLDSVSLKILQAVENSPAGIASLDVLKSLGLCGAKSLRTILSRLGKSGRIIRLKRGVYSASPMRDAFACAQSAFNGYLGFSSALYLHKLITEVPFTITVVTTNVSAMKKIGEYEFRAVALKEKAVGFERKGPYVVSSRAKTLFDCAYLPRYSVPMEKLVQAYRSARLSDEEWREFDSYAPAGRKAAARVNAVKKEVLGG
ncbi:hypothetical protein H0O00_00800 [Candidatus Micrarchaeota archaeon]|nr:hypothetical protein [Candidatus Micrarchaeota archaeon]